MIDHEEFDLQGDRAEKELGKLVEKQDRQPGFEATLHP